MKIVIIGSVAAGTSVAAKARRNTEEAEIIIYEQGKDISYSVCGIPYQIGGEVEKIEELTPRDSDWFKKRYNISIFTQYQVTAVLPEEKTLKVTDLISGETKTEDYDQLVFATGAIPFSPPPFDRQTYTNVFPIRTIENNREVQAFMEEKHPQSAVIIGAGYIGVEMTEQLVNKGLDVTLVESGNQILPSMDKEMAFRIEEHLCEKGVHLMLGTSVQTIQGEEVAEVLCTTQEEKLNADLVIISAGVRPNTRLAEKAGVRIGSTGAIAVGEQMQTNLPDVYAVGDAAESFSVLTQNPIYRPLGSTANKMGRIAGDAMTGGNLKHRGILGTSIIRSFDWSVGQTGLTEKEAILQGYDVEILFNIKPDHAAYLGGKELTIKALADRRTGKLLGAQIIGQEGVDKRIDVLATAMTFGAEAEDLFHLDLAYAPPFATTKDPVLYTGMALDNALHKSPLLTPGDLLRRQEKGDQFQIIDTRSQKDYEKSHVEGAVPVPLSELRDHLNELDKNVTTVVYCNKGVTGNAAQNLLLNKGFKEVYNLSGGNKNYQIHKKMLNDKGNY